MQPAIFDSYLKSSLRLCVWALRLCEKLFLSSSRTLHC